VVVPVAKPAVHTFLLPHTAATQARVRHATPLLYKATFRPARQRATRCARRAWCEGAAAAKNPLPAAVGLLEQPPRHRSRLRASGRRADAPTVAETVPATPPLVWQRVLLPAVFSPRQSAPSRSHVHALAGR
jgi:hypothetical protein